MNSQQRSYNRMTKKPPLWADLLLTLWVLVVAVFYFGGYFLPAQIGVYTPLGGAFYALMLLISVAMLAWNYLHRADAKIEDTKSAANEDSAKKDKTNSHKGHAHED